MEFGESEKKIRRKRGRGREEGTEPTPPLVFLFFSSASIFARCPHDRSERLEQAKEEATERRETVPGAWRPGVSDPFTSLWVFINIYVFASSPHTVLRHLQSPRSIQEL